jgi:tetratricopeptide (TPR) repeat protein
MCNTKTVAKPIMLDGVATTTAKPEMVHTDSSSSSSEEDEENTLLVEVLHDLEQQRHDLGDSHVQVAETWNSLGLIRLHMQHNIRDAIECHERALRIYRKQQEEAKQAMAVTLHDLGYCYERLGQRDRALQQYQEAMTILKNQNYQASHPRRIATQRSMDRVLRSCSSAG